MSRRLRLSRLLVVAIAMASASVGILSGDCPSAHAQPNPPPLGAQAVARGREALASFDKQDFAEALARFREADALYHSPVFVLYAARSLRALGRWREALAALRMVVAESLDKNAPPPWKQAHLDAQSEADALAAEMPSIVVRVDGGSSQAVVTIDDEKTAAGEHVELDPGPHRVVATDGSWSDARTVLAAKAVAASVVFTVSPSSTTPRSPLPRAAEGPPPARPTAGYIVGGGGLVALVAGGIVGGLALGSASRAKGRLPNDCSGTVCPNAAMGDVDAAYASTKRLGITADVLFVTGTVALLASLYLVLRTPTPAAARQGAR